MQLGDENSERSRERRRDVPPVGGAAAEPMDEHDRGSSLGPGDEVAEPTAPHDREPLLEAGDRLCVRHAGKLFFDRWKIWEGRTFDSCRQDNRSGSMSPSTREREAGFLLRSKEG